MDAGHLGPAMFPIFRPPGSPTCSSGNRGLLPSLRVEVGVSGQEKSGTSRTRDSKGSGQQNPEATNARLSEPSGSSLEEPQRSQGPHDVDRHVKSPGRPTSPPGPAGVPDQKAWSPALAAREYVRPTRESPGASPDFSNSRAAEGIAARLGFFGGSSGFLRQDMQTPLSPLLRRLFGQESR